MEHVAHGVLPEELPASACPLTRKEAGLHMETPRGRTGLQLSVAPIGPQSRSCVGGRAVGASEHTHDSMNGTHGTYESPRRASSYQCLALQIKSFQAANSADHRAPGMPY